MNSFKYFLIMVLLIPSNFIQAQSELDEIKATITTMFEGMRIGDSAMVHSSFSNEVLMQTLAENKEGKVQLTTGSLSSFLKAVGTPHTEVWDERIEFGDIKIDGPLASVWTPYKFFRGENFSHCGVNSFQLSKEGKAWKIIYLVDTRRKEECQ